MCVLIVIAACLGSWCSNSDHVTVYSVPGFQTISACEDARARVIALTASSPKHVRAFCAPLDPKETKR